MNAELAVEWSGRGAWMKELPAAWVEKLRNCLESSMRDAMNRIEPPADDILGINGIFGPPFIDYKSAEFVPILTFLGQP